MNIQRFSLHDGPGLRTTVFLMGCSLRCRWCHNPESWIMRPRMMFYARKCMGCGRCAALCKRKAHHFGTDGHRMDLSRCGGCPSLEACAAACPSEALTVCGRDFTPGMLADILERDKLFYGPEGGVTFSGGEALLQADFLLACLEACKARGLHTCVDTAANVPLDSVRQVEDCCDLFLIDLKAMNPDLHRHLFGDSNERILRNIRYLSEMHHPMWIRIPLAAGKNASEEELRAMADFLCGLSSVSRVDLFPVLNHAQDKYRSLGLESESFNEGTDLRKLLDGALDVMAEQSHGTLPLCRLM